MKGASGVGLSETMKALGDPVRREILNLLKGGRMTAGDIASRFDMTAATVSYHLAQLKKAGLIFESREKNFIYYSLNASVFGGGAAVVTGFEGGEGIMKINKKELLLTSLVCLLPLLAGAILYPRLPETMATHWGFDGTANGWSSRAATVFGLPLFILALHLVCSYAESRDDKAEECESGAADGDAVVLSGGLAARRSAHTRHGTGL